MDKTLIDLQTKLSNVYNDPELQRHRVSSQYIPFDSHGQLKFLEQYDLRAVLVYAGVPGRKSIYSYVQDTQGTWWKTVDQTVTEVLVLLFMSTLRSQLRFNQVPEEVVLTDTTGAQIGAGPYLLLYSQSVPDDHMNEPRRWPRMLKVRR